MNNHKTIVIVDSVEEDVITVNQEALFLHKNPSRSERIISVCDGGSFDKIAFALNKNLDWVLGRDDHGDQLFLIPLLKPEDGME